MIELATKRMNPGVDAYLAEGCGRCPLGGTPACKVHNWPAELAALRALLLDSELTEEVKWKVPCYTYQGSNVVILAAFKEYCSLSFFKGALLADPHGILEKPGENTQAARHIPFTSVAQIVAQTPILKAYLEEAVAVEKAGLTVTFKSAADFDLPAELVDAFDQDPDFRTAFEALTPGRQRGYLLQFAAPKQAKTRSARIEKYRAQILAGKGLQD